jgi:hypothetical protein
MRKCYVLLAGLAVVAGATLTMAQVPQPTPPVEFPVTPESGAWLICIASYTGEHSASLAHDLAVELRQRYKLPAYTLNRGAEQRAKQEEEVRRMREESPGRRVKVVRIDDQYAVLIGGYKDMDAAASALTKIKALPTPDERLCDKAVYATASASPTREEKVTTKEVPVNPFKTAFVVHNPTLPMPAPVASTGPDPDLRRLNHGESYSLIDNCKKPWTMVVATFQGAARVQSKDSPSLIGALTGQIGDQASATAMNAHNLAQVLHETTGFDTYVLHTRYYSVVTVGGFSQANDPMMATTLQSLKKKALLAPNMPVQFLDVPLPMQVPKS